MFATIKQIFNPANKDLQKRILFTLMSLFIFKLGTTIVVPIVPSTSLNNLGFLLFSKDKMITLAYLVYLFGILCSPLKILLRHQSNIFYIFRF